MKKMTIIFGLLVAFAFWFTKMAQVQISSQQYHASVQQLINQAKPTHHVQLKI